MDEDAEFARVQGLFSQAKKLTHGGKAVVLIEGAEFPAGGVDRKVDLLLYPTSATPPGFSTRSSCPSVRTGPRTRCASASGGRRRGTASRPPITGTRSWPCTCGRPNELPSQDRGRNAATRSS